MKRILAFALSLCTLFSLFAVYAAAEEGEQQGEYRHVSLSETTVMEDLESLEKAQMDDPDGFKLSDYPAVSGSKKIYFLSLTEDYRYSDEGFVYRLYLYVYNPGQLEIATDNAVQTNCLQMAVDGFNQMHYRKYQLDFVSNSPDRLFYKFSVEIKSDLFSYMKTMSKNARVYNISGIEIVADYGSGELKAVDHIGTIDGKLDQTIKIQYTGNNPSVCAQIDGDDLLHLDFKLGHYRVSNGADTNSYKQLMTAWFEIPKKYFDNEGFNNLQLINYTCMKKDDLVVMTGGPVDVFEYLKTFDVDPNNQFKPEINVDTTCLQPCNLHFSVCHGEYEYYITGRLKKMDLTYDLFSTYSLPDSILKKYLVSDSTNIKVNKTINSQNRIDVIVPFTYGSGQISAEKLYALMNTDKNFSYSRTSWDMKDIGFIMDVTDPSNNYNTESFHDATIGFSNFWKKAEAIGFWNAIGSLFDHSVVADDSIDNLSPFQIVSPTDANLSIPEISKKYLIDEYNALQIFRTLDNSTDSYVCLLRFDLADYNILFDGVLSKDSKGESNVFCPEFVIRRADGDEYRDINSSKAPFVYSCAMYKDFDVLDLGFSTPEGIKIVPVNADPVKFYMADIVPKDELMPVVNTPNLNFAPLLIAALVVMVAIALIVPIARATGKVYDGTVKVGKSAVKKMKQIKQKKSRKKQR